MGLVGLFKNLKEKFNTNKKIKKLKKLHYQNCEKFILPISLCKVIKVYDGDTITIGFTLNKINYRHSVRLSRIDTPEIRTSNLIEKEASQIVKAELENKILNKIIFVDECDYDKYGRLLAEIYLIDNGFVYNINDWLLDNKYAVKYNGGKKEDINWSHIINPVKNNNEKFI
jgi:endonuclease YncB( thermonuclease family)